jgi:ABC-type dipeptide/oligopeptide/nickel transport system permease subunit
MGDFIGTIAGGIVGLVEGALRGIGDALRSMAAAADAALPGGLLFIVIFVALVVGAWNLAHR